MPVVFESRLRAMKKSSSSSSMINTRTFSLGSISGIGTDSGLNIRRIRELHNLEPKLTQPLDGRRQSIKGDRFRDERVHSQIIAAKDIQFGLRGGKHDHWNAPEIWI